jgi:biotin transporter BioY
VCTVKDTAELKFSHLASCAYASVINCSSSCLGGYELHYVVGMAWVSARIGVRILILFGVLYLLRLDKSKNNNAISRVIKLIITKLSN